MQIKVISLNLWLGQMIDQATHFLLEKKPDVVCLQEVYLGKDSRQKKKYLSFEILKQKLPLKYYYVSPTFREINRGFEVDQANVIFSKFPITSSKTIFYDIPYKKFTDYLSHPKLYPFISRNLQLAVVSLPNRKKLNVFNTQGIWALHGKDNKRRINMGNIIASEVKNKKYVVLLGDFNVRPNTKTINLIEACLKNVFTNELKTTFNLIRKSNKKSFANAVVDMFFISNDIKIVDHSCIDADVSDHLPLLVTLTV